VQRRDHVTNAHRRGPACPRQGYQIHSDRRVPRFEGENFERNRRHVDIVAHIGEAHDATPAQVALAWLLQRGNDVVPIPGTKHVQYLEDNAAAVRIRLTKEDLQQLDRLAGEVAGSRYRPEEMSLVGK
jgi:aryl-alcohol dehydrogenase-like predicted oxidoreductase